MRKSVLYLAVLLFCLLASRQISFSQDEAKGSMTVGPFGAITRPPKAVQVSPSIAALLPKNATVRGVLQAHLTREGEEFVIYEVPWDKGKDEVCCTYGALVLRNGKLVSDLKKEMEASDVSLQAYAVFSLESGRDAIVFAYSSTGDGSGMDFEFLCNSGSQYEVSFTLATLQGRVEVLEGLPTRLLVWSARDDLDGKDSCVWCKHHYEVKTYLWNGRKFEEQPRVSRITTTAIVPGTIASQPIVIKRNPKV